LDVAQQLAADDRVIGRDSFLQHWQGHRRLTRRVIEAFPEDQLFTFSVGGMRPFGELAQELLAMTTPMMRGIATEDWGQYDAGGERSKTDVLRRWDEATAELEQYWASIPNERFQQTMTAFGQYTDVVANLLRYVVDNEIHHRGQGYVYLRALGIEPPHFWER
jgi:uncharacterized damage-inducible protein DinB